MSNWLGDKAVVGLVRAIAGFTIGTTSTTQDTNILKTISV